MRYGLPYKGSKNSIAEWVVDNLPKADIFCDLFYDRLSDDIKSIIQNGTARQLSMFDFEENGT